MVKEYKKDKGYILLYKPNHPNSKKNYIFEHRFVVENKIGRYLTKNEIVHHINGVKNDNRIENLMLFENQSKHAKFHKKIIQFGVTRNILRQINERFDKI